MKMYSQSRLNRIEEDLTNRDGKTVFRQSTPLPPKNEKQNKRNHKRM